MNKKMPHKSASEINTLNLSAAVERFVAQGGIINVIDERQERSCPLPTVQVQVQPVVIDIHAQADIKLQLLKELVAKGAGVSALQYSMRMNKKDIKKLAVEHGVKIAFSRPFGEMKKEARHDVVDVDDKVAGHAMHYSSLGYTAPEIARMLDLSIRQVWDIGRAYRFEFRQQPDAEALDNSV